FGRRPRAAVVRIIRICKGSLLREIVGAPLRRAFMLATTILAASCATQEPASTAVGDYLSGRLAAKVRAVPTAADAFEQAHLAAPQDPEILTEAFYFNLAAGDVEAAAQLAQKIITEVDGHSDGGLAGLVVATRLMAKGDYAGVQDVLKAHPQSRGQKAIGRSFEAWAIDGRAGAEAAISALDAAAASSDQIRAFTIIHRALLSEKAGRLEEARAAYQLSLAALNIPPVRAAYGAFLERQGDADEARKLYDVLSGEPGPEREGARRGVARLEAGEASDFYADPTPAQGAALALYAYGYGALDNMVERVNAAARAGANVSRVSYNLPLAMMQLALYLDPALDPARTTVGDIFALYGDQEKAINVLSKVSTASPYYERAQIEIAGAERARGRPDRAIAILQRTSEKLGAGFSARFALANLLANEDRPLEAADVLTEAINSFPEDFSAAAWRYHIARAEARLALDDWPQAEADLERAVELAPEEPTTLNYLGYSWAERGINLEEAFALLEKAIALRPDSGAIIDSLGWAYFQLGQYEEAVLRLEEAAALEPADPTITDHLGDVYWRLDRKIEAQYQWRHVLELDPSEELAESVHKKLKDGLPAIDD
ncbi:MAG: tetratricopeptide repeat protein, partial [Pseudomonadota bacterium]